jgi:microcystin-dependent protein
VISDIKEWMKSVEDRLRELDRRIRSRSESTVLTGALIMWPAAAVPSGYLLCAGGTFQSTQYPELATLLGDTYGTHSGTTYYLPDFRARSPIGAGGSIAPDQGTGYGSFPLGFKYGEQRHVLTVAELASHGHSFVGGSHTFLWGIGGLAGSVWLNSAVATAGNPPGNYAVTSQGYWNGTAASGSSNSHENMHPVLGINFIIKT